MNISISWKNDNSTYINEEELKEGIIRDFDKFNIKPCCNDAMVILEAKGPLNEIIEGSVTCKCKQVLLSFSANADLKETTLNFIKETK